MTSAALVVLGSRLRGSLHELLACVADRDDDGVIDACRTLMELGLFVEAWNRVDDLHRQMFAFREAYKGGEGGLR